MKTEVFFDVETKKLFRDTQNGKPEELGVSIVSTFIRIIDDPQNPVNGKFESFWENEFERMWELFRKADRIIGFNSLNFDVPALMPYQPYDFSKLPHFDILEKIKASSGKRLSLNQLAQTNLGTGKIDVGTNAVLYWNKGDAESLAKLKKYCEEDVNLTKDLYDFGIKNKKLKYTDKWNSIKIIEVDFSYPQNEVAPKNQFSLF